MLRVNFVSFTFLFAFGLGAFAGIGLALLAIALATPEPEPIVVQPDPAAIVEQPTETPTVTPPSPTPTPTPIPAVRALATLPVRIGPDEGYAVLGTLARGTEIDVQGRDANGDWVAIGFPPGTSARGWIPAEEVEGLTLFQILDLGILQGSLLDATPRSPLATRTPVFSDAGTNGSGFSGGNEDAPAVVTSTPLAPTATPSATPFRSPTPLPVEFGPTDLVIAGVTVEGDGRLRIVVENLGPGDVPGSNLAIRVEAQGFSPELLGASGVLRPGQTAVFRTSTIQLTAVTDVRITIDAEGQLTDINRANNRLDLILTP